jgi:hypothetical protein
LLRRFIVSKSKKKKKKKSKKNKGSVRVPTNVKLQARYATNTQV